MNTPKLPRDAVSRAILKARPMLDCTSRSGSFAAKIVAASVVTAPVEEFNVWHANADKTEAAFAWGDARKQKR